MIKSALYIDISYRFSVLNLIFSQHLFSIDFLGSITKFYLPKIAEAWNINASLTRAFKHHNYESSRIKISPQNAWFRAKFSTLPQNTHWLLLSRLVQRQLNCSNTLDDVGFSLFVLPQIHFSSSREMKLGFGLLVCASATDNATTDVKSDDRGT